MKGKGAMQRARNQSSVGSEPARAVKAAGAAHRSRVSTAGLRCD
jgi:hypothetical protein